MKRNPFFWSDWKSYQTHNLSSDIFGVCLLAFVFVIFLNLIALVAE